ncbi:MAG: acyltransferase [Pseudomonadales bacterium]|nr:acyltransferase [Pseudomonadales bacterium]
MTQENFTRDELLEIGFSSVGNNVIVSRDVRFFAISGSLGNNIRIDTFTILTGEIVLEDNVHLSPLCFLSATGGRITMEDGSGIGPQCAILTKSDDYTRGDLSSEGKVAGDISIGHHSIIGAGCKIFPGVTIGPEVSIGSNCMITSDVKAGDMVVSRGASTITVGNRADQ